MPVPVHARLRVGGTLYGAQSWSIGCTFGLQVLPDPNGALSDPFAVGIADVQGALEDWCDLIKTNAGSVILNGVLRTLLSAQGNISMIRASRVGTNGRETEVAEIQVNPAVAGSSTAAHPVSTSVVASLLTGRPGASYRGRIYWPAMRGDLNLGRLENPAPSDIAADTAAFLHAAAVDLGTALSNTLDIRPGVVSATKNAHTKVTSVRVGNRLDSQRRRRGSEQEAYSSSAVPQ